MGEEELEEITGSIAERTQSAVRELAFTRSWQDALRSHIDAICAAQQKIYQEFPRLREESEFWETLWHAIASLRNQWDKLRRAAEHRGEDAGQTIRDVSQNALKELYGRTRRFITDYAPRTPGKHHFQLGIDCVRPDCAHLLDRIEGLYESVKRQGRFPAVAEDIEFPEGGSNFGIIYGGGWNVSAYSVLGSAAGLEGLNALVAFDHPGRSLFRRSAAHTVRLAPSGLLRGEDGRYLLATFRRPLVLHFVCPHQWTGPAPHDLGIPVLRSRPIVTITTNKNITTEALREYRESSGFEFNTIDEEFIPRPDFPADIGPLTGRVEKALNALAERHIDEIIVKPSRGEQARDVEDFSIPSRKDAAVRHAVDLALDCGALLQEKVIPAGGLDYNWRIFVAASAEGNPQVVGQFARLGRGPAMEMVEEGDMLRRAGVPGAEGDQLQRRMHRTSLHAFRAISCYSRRRMQDFPNAPLGDVGSYHTPYLLGIDLIGDARVMEINGSEVAGMWSDDRLHPQSRGRTSRTVLRSARRAAMAYKKAIESVRERA